MKKKTKILISILAAVALGGNCGKAGESLETGFDAPSNRGVLPGSSMGLSVDSLRCEYLSNPLGIDVLKPRLSWQIQSEERGVRQSAYQILVASSEQTLAKDSGDIWDSGKVCAPDSIHIAYAGKSLSSGAKCYWKVRVWTGGKSAEASTWSQPATWSMGLLNASDWKAQWIGAPTPEMVEPAPMLRKEFAVSKKLSRATAYVSGLGYFELSLNGRKVGDHELDPKNTRYDKRVLYVTHDVTRAIQDGRNALGVILGTGWYNYHNRNAWGFENAPWRAKPQLLLQLELEFADGTRQTVVSDETWKYSTGPIIFDALLAGETYDARLEKDGWNRGGYDDSQWAAAKVVAAPKGVVSAQMIHPIRVTQRIKPSKIKTLKNGAVVVEFPQNMAGTFELKVRGAAGTDIRIETGEAVHGADGSLDTRSIKVFSKSYPFQTYHYICKGDGIETWRPRFMYDGFKYAQITGFPGTFTEENIVALVEHSDLPAAGTFTCSNPLLNDIQRCTWWSYVNNFHGHPTDCPNREKNGWTGDAHLAAETGLYNFDGAANYTQWMLDFRDEQRESGEVPGIIPTGGWGYHWGNGPAWDSALLLIPWYLYQYRGDVRILEANYENMKRYVDYLATRARKGIVNLGLGDWCADRTGTPVPVTSTAYYASDAALLSKIAALLGKKDDAAKYAALHEDVRRAFNRDFFKAETRQYGNGQQTALSAALYQGLVAPVDEAGVVSNLVANVESCKGHLDCGILGAKYILHALTDHGRSDVAYTIATQTTRPSWGCWVRRGATTLWEKWDGGFGGTQNHIMFGDISAWFYKALAGIRPGAPGFKQIIIKPEPVGDLTSVTATHNCPYGLIGVSWKREGRRFQLDVEIPANTTATVFIPAHDANTVTEGGKSAGQVPGIKALVTKNGCALYEIGSGKYSFAAE